MSDYVTSAEPITTEEKCNVSVDFRGKLDSGELLTGTPTVTGATSLNITNQQVSTGVLNINGYDVPAGAAVSFTIDPTESGHFEVKLLANTDQGQERGGYIHIDVIPARG